MRSAEDTAGTMANRGFRLSATTVKTFELCNRKWALEQAIIDAGGSTFENDAMRFGTEGHRIAENWLKHGKRPPQTKEGNAFRQGIPHLPTPNPGLIVEEEWEQDLGLSFPVKGRVDCAVPPALNKGRLLVMDHKFTKEKRYALTREKLIVDAQAVLYGSYYMARFGVVEADLKWIYYVASGPDRVPKGVHPVTATIKAKEIAPRFFEIRSHFEQMVQIKKSRVDPMTVKPEPSACGAFGGCPFREKCKIPMGQVLGAHFRQFEKMHPHEGLKKTTPSVEYWSEHGDRYQSCERKSWFNELAKAEESVARAAERGKKLYIYKCRYRDHYHLTSKAGKDVLPEKSKSDIIHTPTEEKNTMGSMADKLKKKGAGKKTADKAEEKTPAAGSKLLTDRLNKLKGVNPPAVEVEEEVEEVPPPKREPTPPTAPKRGAPHPADQAEPKPKPKAGAPLVVLFDCVPVKGREFRHLIEILAPVIETAQEVAKVNHWNMAEFGKGPSLLAAGLDLALEGVSGMIVVDSSTAEARAVKEVLINRADVVIRGL